MIPAQKIFSISSNSEFESVALEVFQYQFDHNAVYQEFCGHLKIEKNAVRKLKDIPFLPIEFFKTKRIVTGNSLSEMVFTSSGTTGSSTSKHFISDLSIYEQSYREGFRHFYGQITDYCVLALLPSYLDREGSSLIYMVDDLIKRSRHADSGFYLKDTVQLTNKLMELDAGKSKILLIGVSFALLDLVEKYQFQLKNTVIMETGGMKGRRKEMVREELHDILKNGFGTLQIHSEYGMTELLSQAYSLGDGIFKSPPWMKVLTRDTEDPLTLQEVGKTGGINIIDLANINSCAFIATQDLGKVYQNGSFEVLGRFDHSDVRGCNLMVL